MAVADRLRRLVEAADPEGAVTLRVAWLREQLGENGAEPEPEPAAADWRERIWTCPDDVLLGVQEIAESLSRPVSWVYRRTGRRAQEPRLPTQKLAGEVVVRAADLRRWIRAHLEQGP